jgi:hypothetical protein
MQTGNDDVALARLAERLERLSAKAWVVEVDRLARFDVELDEAVLLLGGRFAGDYLDSRRTIIWPMLEYLYVRFASEPVERSPARRDGSFERAKRGAAA